MGLGLSISLDRCRNGKGALEISQSLYIAGQKSVAFLTFKSYKKKIVHKARMYTMSSIMSSAYLTEQLAQGMYSTQLCNIGDSVPVQNYHAAIDWV